MFYSGRILLMSVFTDIRWQLTESGELLFGISTYFIIKKKAARVGSVADIDLLICIIDR